MKEGRVSPALKELLLRRCEGLRAIEGALAVAGPDGQRLPDGGKVLMVISAGSGEGRTTATACLGWALAASGRTLVIDGDLPSAGLGRLFGVPANPGLTNVIHDGLNVGEAVRPTETDNLHILPRGREMPEEVAAIPAGLLRGDPFARFVTSLRPRWDYVVFDTPPFLAEAAAALMARHVDGAVLVLEAGRTRWDAARTTAERLQGAGGHLTGAVLNRHRSYLPHAFA